MSLSKPLDTILHLLDARSRGDVAGAIACYEPDAIVVVEPGKFARGEAAIRTFVQATIALPIIFEGHVIVEADGIAVHFSEWTIGRADGSEISARTTDVVRRQPNGNWLVAIDNPWGTSLLDGEASPS